MTNIEKCSTHKFLLRQLKSYQGGRNFTQRRSRGLTTRKDMLTSASRGIVNWQTQKTEQLYTVSTPCLDDHNCKKEEPESAGELSNVCSQIVFKCLYVARIGGPDILWSVNKLARATKWTTACDKRSARLISHVHHTNNYRHYFHVGNTAQHCRWGLFQDSDFAGDLEDSKPTSGGILCFFGSGTFAPRSGCARSKRQCLTDPQNWTLFRWMLVCEWMKSLPLICGMW